MQDFLAKGQRSQAIGKRPSFNEQNMHSKLSDCLIYNNLIPQESRLINFVVLFEKLSHSCTSVRDTTFNTDELDFSGTTHTR